MVTVGADSACKIKTQQISAVMDNPIGERLSRMLLTPPGIELEEEWERQDSGRQTLFK